MRGLRVRERGEVQLGDDEQVRRGLRMRVREGDNLVVLKDALDGNRTSGDFAEDAVGVGRGAHGTDDTATGVGSEKSPKPTLTLKLDVDNESESCVKRVMRDL